MIEKPERIYPCDCLSEGLVVYSEFLADDNSEVVVSRDGKMEDDFNYYGVGISFWGFGPYENSTLPWRRRIVCAWNILKTGHPWLDMVMLKPEVAKSFAYRILYMLGQIEKKLSMKKDELSKLIPPKEERIVHKVIHFYQPLLNQDDHIEAVFNF